MIARSIARALGLDEDLTEALALAHDLGHPPFGHAGEEALNIGMKPFGGSDHNAQSLRIVTLLESRYAGWDGLITDVGNAGGAGQALTVTCAIHRLTSPITTPGINSTLALMPARRAQVAALADDIAYHAHDLDRWVAGAAVFTPDDLRHLPVSWVSRR